MLSTKQLPSNYQQAGKLDIKHDRWLILWLNLAALGLTIASVFFFYLGNQPGALKPAGSAIFVAEWPKFLADAGVGGAGNCFCDPFS